jgi:cytochrome c-type biogenesis protein CcmE
MAPVSFTLVAHMDQSLDRAPVGAAPRRKFLVGGAVIAVTLVGLVAWAMSRPGSTAFYLTTSEVISRGATTGAEQYRVNGNVVPGTLNRDGLETTFVISDGQTDMTIFTDSPLPDSFRDDPDTQVVARGTYDGERFTATEVLAKCPSKFKAKA